jgi:RNA polymerase sigma-70 factor (ECF subfamily)
MAETASETIEQWVNEYSDYLFNFAMKKLSDRDLVLDLIQDTFVAAFKGLDKFEGRSAPQTWLVSILNRKIIDHWRKENSRKTDVASHFFRGDGDKMEGFWILGNAPSQRVSSIENTIEKEEQARELSECLDTLPNNWKGIMYAKYMEEKRGEEITEEFGISSSNFWVIVHRAKIVLRDCLEKKWF